MLLLHYSSLCELLALIARGEYTLVTEFWENSLSSTGFYYRDGTIWTLKDVNNDLFGI